MSVAIDEVDLDMWSADSFGTAVANRDWSALDHIWTMEHRLKVVVEQGARDILMGMPTNHNRLSPRAELVAVRRVWGPQNMSLGPILADARVRWQCDEVGRDALPAACMEVVRRWKDTVTCLDIVLFHKPVFVRGEPSILHFRLGEKKEIILGHTCTKGLWYTPGTLFVFAMPPRRR